MPTHRSQSRVGPKRGSWQNVARALRRLLVTRKNDHRNPCTAHKIHQLPAAAHIVRQSRGRCRRRRRSSIEKVGTGQESSGQEEGETNQREKAHHETVMNITSIKASPSPKLPPSLVVCSSSHLLNPPPCVSSFVFVPAPPSPNPFSIFTFNSTSSQTVQSFVTKLSNRKENNLIFFNSIVYLRACDRTACVSCML